jgi:photosystem II stability/assembly factor-like uncharacterized protein
MKLSLRLFFLTLIFSAGNLPAQTWTTHNIGAVDDVIAMSFPTDDTGYVVTSAYALRKTMTGAMTWTSVATPVAVSGVYFITGQKGFAYADTVVYRTLNGGATWSVVLHDPVIGCQNMQFVNASTGYLTAYSGNSTRLYTTTNGGTSWSHVNSVLNYIFDNALFFTSVSNGFIGCNNAIVATANGGASFTPVWNDMTFSYTPTAMSFPNQDTGYAIDLLGYTLRTVNAGATWNAIPNPAGAGLWDLYFINGMKGFVCGGPGFSSGWIQETNDGGATWTPALFTASTLGCMDFPNDHVGYAAGQNGLIVKYSDALTGISSNENARRISVFPNPSADGRIVIDLGNEQCNRVEIYNSLGENVNFPMENAQNGNRVVIEGMQAGMYFVSILLESGGREVRQMVVL